MTPKQSIRIESIITVPHCACCFDRVEATVIGYVLGRQKTALRIQYTATGRIELRDDLTQENTELITY